METINRTLIGCRDRPSVDNVEFPSERGFQVLESYCVAAVDS